MQGVGFRPFAYRAATALALSGFVENTSRGVEIQVQGARASVEAFAKLLRDGAPPAARVFDLETSDLRVCEGEGFFEIRASRLDPVAGAVVPPDLATCPECLAELFAPEDRRFGYPFSNCTACGPRYSIIESLPYDRPRTSLASFPLCPDCAREYGDPANRRFHAQPTACPVCGPTLWALDADGRAASAAPLTLAAEALKRGETVALLGVGGFHLACDAANEAAVVRLRRRKCRPAKPLAVMVADLGAARQLAHVGLDAERLLLAPQAPIVLVKRRAGGAVAPSVAPGHDRLGLFLPYSPLHHLVFRESGLGALVMTSGNRSDEPLLWSRDEGVEKLRGVADLFLVHDRPILHPVDDSVVQTTPAGPVVVRRARGYAPAPVALPNPHGRVVLALGGELASAAAVTRGAYAYLTPHCGDLKSLDVEEGFRRGVDHLLSLLRVTPDLVACDRHPDYRSSRYADEWEARGVEVVRVPHHEAHGAGCMAENGFEGAGVVLALDGLGYGGDGTVWGGELLAGRPGAFRRAGHLAQVPQPGGDRAAQEPWRMAASHLRRLLGPGWKQTPLAAFQERSPEELAALDTLLEKGLHAPLSSSCGRLFDAASALLGFSGSLLYTAQAALELEGWACAAHAALPYPCGVPLRREGAVVLDPGPLLHALLTDVLAERPRPECSLAFHGGLAALWALGAAEVCSDTSCRDVFLTGGCMQNQVFLSALSDQLDALGLVPHFHREIPPNDGGLCFGQAAWALAARPLA